MNKLFQYLQRPLPYRTRNRSAVQVLLIINILVFIITSIFPEIIRYLAINPYYFFQKLFLWTPLSYMFSHAGFSHILFNMLGLYFFGSIIERQWGTDEFYVLYFSTGILSGILSLIIFYFSGSLGVFLIGASGAIYAILLVFATLYPNAQMYIFGIFPITAKILILIYIGIQLLSLRQGTESGVSYLTHTFGLAIAWIYLLVRHRIDPYKHLFSH